MDDALIREVIDHCRLSIDIEDGRRLMGTVSTPVGEMSIEERNATLLLLERFVLKSQGGHMVSIKFGHSDAINNPRCIICRRPVDASGWSLRIISRWETTQIWLTWHDYCLEDAEVGIDYDLLTGEATSPINFI